MSKTSDQIVIELLKKVEQKKKEIGASERPSWNTHCSFGFQKDSASNRINIQVEKDIRNLIEIFGFIIGEHQKWQYSCDDLEINDEKYPFDWLGFSAQSWLEDIKTRIDQLQLKSKREDLAKLEARVNALVSPEQRREIELAELAKILQ